MIIDWIQEWYTSQCDGEWEHEYGVKIQTMDNPGWWIVIDLKYTNLEDVRVKQEEVVNTLGEWYSLVVQDAVFTSFCSPKNLLLVLEEFKLLAELGENGYLRMRPKVRYIPIYEGYSLSKGLPKIVVKKLVDIIDEDRISTEDMPNRGKYLVERIQPYLEKVTKTSHTNIETLTMLVYKSAWDYINSNGM